MDVTSLGGLLGASLLLEVFVGLEGAQINSIPDQGRLHYLVDLTVK